jgi:hypothetical protein
MTGMTPFAYRVMVCCLLAGLLGCGGGRNGVVIAGDGSISENSAENARDRGQQQIASDLTPLLAPRTVIVAITPLPHWQTESRTRSEGWHWHHAAVVVHVSAPCSENQRAQISQTVRRRLSPAMTTGPDHCVVQIVEMPTSADRPATTEPRPGRTYIVQAGDTLADISAAFYGSTQHWRTIAFANPDCDPGNLRPGMPLVIPLSPVPLQ